MVKIYIGITDYEWFRFLGASPGLAEVNFWQPGGQTNFRALQLGELFLFKLHSPRNFIVGGGIFTHSSILPISLAWESFGTSNGAPSLEIMRQRVAQYRREAPNPKQDYHIGCRVLTEPFFLPESDWIPVPASWARSIQVGRTYDTSEEDGRTLWHSVMERIAFQKEPGFSEPRYGEPMLIRPRLGQGSFRVAITDAYGRRCALTGEKTLPILDAAHIQPYGAGGSHEVQNGVLLRTDVHRLFDLGYVTIADDHRFVVGKRLKEDFTNGKHYYAMHGQTITPPKNPTMAPSRDALRWHQSQRFLG